MKPLILALIGPFLVVLPTWVSLGQIPARPVAEVSEAEYQVLSSYINSALTGNEVKRRVGSDVSSIVIVNITKSDRDDTGNEGLASPGKLTKYLRKNGGLLDAATINNFRKINSAQASFRASFDVPVKYQLVDEADINSIFKNHGWWPDYYKKYPGSRGWLELSRVGFSPDGKQALFYVVNSCGDMCGGGSYVVMVKRDSGWGIAKEIPVWAS